MEFGLKPYNFEPEYTEEELAEREAASQNENSGQAEVSVQLTNMPLHALPI